MLSDSVGGQEILTRIDPLEGRKEVLASLPIAEDNVAYFSVSPDGSEIASVEEFRDEFRIVKLNPVAVQTIHPEPRRQKLQMPSWSPDGRKLYITAYPDEGGQIFEFDRQGRNRLLFQRPYGWLGEPIPSPDGKRLAFVDTAGDSNVTLLEHF